MDTASLLAEMRKEFAVVLEAVKMVDNRVRDLENLISKLVNPQDPNVPPSVSYVNAALQKSKLLVSEENLTLLSPRKSKNRSRSFSIGTAHLLSSELERVEPISVSDLRKQDMSRESELVTLHFMHQIKKVAILTFAKTELLSGVVRQLQTELLKSGFSFSATSLQLSKNRVEEVSFLLDFHFS
jgi:hypothetical protein